MSIEIDNIMMGGPQPEAMASQELSAIINRESIRKSRQRIHDILTGILPGLVAVNGPCSNQKDDLIIQEGIRQSKMTRATLAMVHRLPPWKPRSPVPIELPQPWEGLLQTDPKEAFDRMLAEVQEGVEVAMEFGDIEHVYKFGPMISFGWIGSRNVDKRHLAVNVRTGETIGMCIGVKNGLHGNIDSALEQQRFVQGSSVPIFRGGDQCQDPDTWEKHYVEAVRKTNGAMIVDVAHGGEMAHDPKQQFKKSVAGQIACMEHVIELAAEGVRPNGIMIEASDHVYTDPYRATDPNMPFDTSLDGISRLHNIIMGSR